MSRPKLLSVLNDTTKDTAYSRLNNPVDVEKSDNVIKIKSSIDIQDGAVLTFKSPCDCSSIDSIRIKRTDYILLDPAGNPLRSDAFKSGAVISVTVDVENKRAYLATPSAYPYDLELATTILGRRYYHKEFNTESAGDIITMPDDLLDIVSIKAPKDSIIHHYSSLIEYPVPPIIVDTGYELSAGTWTIKSVTSVSNEYTYEIIATSGDDSTRLSLDKYVRYDPDKSIFSPGIYRISPLTEYNSDICSIDFTLIAYDAATEKPLAGINTEGRYIEKPFYIGENVQFYLVPKTKFEDSSISFSIDITLQKEANSFKVDEFANPIILGDVNPGDTIYCSNPCSYTLYKDTILRKGDKENSIEIGKAKAINTNSIASGAGTIAGGRLFLIKNYTDNGDGTCTITWVEPGTTAKITRNNKNVEYAEEDQYEVEVNPFESDEEPPVGTYVSLRAHYNHDCFGTIKSYDKATRTMTIDGLVHSSEGDQSETILRENPTECGASIWIVGYPELGTCDMDFLSQGAYQVAAFASGLGTKAQNLGAFAVGEETVAAGRYSFASGTCTEAGYAGFTAGKNTKAIGNHSAAVGSGSVARGGSSFAAGDYSAANGLRSAAIGDHVETMNQGEAALGKNNKTKRGLLFSVGNGSNPYTRSNAFEVDENGNTRTNNVEVNRIETDKIQTGTTPTLIISSSPDSYDHTIKCWHIYKATPGEKSIMIQNWSDYKANNRDNSFIALSSLIGIPNTDIYDFNEEISEERITTSVNTDNNIVMKNSKREVTGRSISKLHFIIYDEYGVSYDLGDITNIDISNPTKPLIYMSKALPEELEVIADIYTPIHIVFMNYPEAGLIDLKSAHSNYSNKIPGLIKGEENKSASPYGTITGTGLYTYGEYESAIGRYNQPRAKMLFSVGNGTDNEHRSNAFELYEDGTTKINKNGVMRTVYAN